MRQTWSVSYMNVDFTFGFSESTFKTLMVKTVFINKLPINWILPKFHLADRQNEVYNERERKRMRIHIQVLSFRESFSISFPNEVILLESISGSELYELSKEKNISYKSRWREMHMQSISWLVMEFECFMLGKSLNIKVWDYKAYLFIEDI